MQDLGKQPMEEQIENEEQTSSNTRNGKVTPPTERGIAPIIIRDNNKWNGVSLQLRQKNIQYTKAKLNTRKGIEVTPASEQDYRQMYKLLKETNIEFFTYQLKSEKPLKVVLRGIPVEISTEEIEEELKHKSYPVTKVMRMNGRNGPMLLVLIEIPREYRSIYNIKTCCGLSLQIEPLKRKDNVTFCHRCLMFGHVQMNCNNEYSCMKYGEHH